LLKHKGPRISPRALVHLVAAEGRAVFSASSAGDQTGESASILSERGEYFAGEVEAPRDEDEALRAGEPARFGESLLGGPFVRDGGHAALGELRRELGGLRRALRLRAAGDGAHREAAES